MSGMLPGTVQWVELRPRDPATGGLVTLRYAGGARERSYYRDDNGQHYKAGLVAAPRFAARIGFGRDGFTGQTIPQASRIQIAPAEADVFDSLAGYFWKDAEITIDAGPETASTFARLFTGTVAGDSIADGVFTFTIADLSTRLDKPFCTARFAGNGGIEGGEEAEGRTKRRSIGRVFNVEGRLLDAANSIFEFGDPAFTLTSWSALRDKGRGGPFSVLPWQGSIAATFAALQASAPVQGGGVVAPSIACAKWWTEPSGPLTADFVGTSGTGGSLAAAALIDGIAASFSGPRVDELAAAVALRPAVAGIHVADETTTGAQMIDRLALGSSLIWVAAPEGVIRLRAWAFHNGGAPVLHGQFIGRERAYAPHYRRRVGFQANNRRHSDSEIAESIRTSNGVLLDDISDRVGDLVKITEGSFPSFDSSGPGDFHVTSLGLRYYRVADVEADLELDGEPIELDGTTLFNSWRRSDPAVRLGGIGGLRLENSIGDNLLDPDVLNTFRRRLTAPFKVQINASATGEIQTEFPLFISVRAKQGNDDISADTDFVATLSPSLNGTINNTPGDVNRGTITLTDFIASGSIKITGTYPDGLEDTIMIDVERASAGQVIGGGAGASSVVDFNWANVTSGTYAQVTDNPLVVKSGPTGDLKFAFYSAFTFSGLTTDHNVEVIARYRTVGAGSWSDVAGSEITGEAATFDPEFATITPGFVGSAGIITQATGANDTDHEVALFARRVAGSATITFASNDSLFRVTQ